MSDNKLTAVDRSDFRRLRKQAKEHQDGWIRAVMEIRDRELYLDEWVTFAAFMEDEYDIGKSHVYRLIEAEETRKKLVNHSPIGDTITKESHLREFAKVPEEAIQAVLDRVVETSQETGEPITAKGIKEAAESIADDKPTPKADKKDLGETIRLERAKFKKTMEAMMRLIDDLQKLRKSGQYEVTLSFLREAIRAIDKW